jgi:uncharacterized protein
MKFLLVLLVVLVGIFLWRSNRQASTQRRGQSGNSTAPPLEMVRCTLCSVHIPLVDAVKGSKGLYCSTDHRLRAEP